MRHLVLIAVLAGPAGMPGHGCAARIGQPRPVRSQRGRATRSPRRARVAHHGGERASSAIAAQGVAAGLGAAFADDVLFLSPRVNVLSGRDAAGSFLTTDALAPSALSWRVIVADVSNDGTQGYTWSEGSSTIDFGTGALARPSFFLIFWRRAAAAGLDRWPVVVIAGGPRRAAIPAGFGTPDTKHRRNFPNTEPAEQAAADPGRRRGVLRRFGEQRQRAGVRAVRRAQRDRPSAAGNTSSVPRPSARRSPATRPT